MAVKVESLCTHALTTCKNWNENRTVKKANDLSAGFTCADARVESWLFCGHFISFVLVNVSPLLLEVPIIIWGKASLEIETVKTCADHFPVCSHTVPISTLCITGLGSTAHYLSAWFLASADEVNGSALEGGRKEKSGTFFLSWFGWNFWQ